MIKTVAPVVCVFDSEYVPCIETGSKVFGYPAKTPHQEARRIMYENTPLDPNHTLRKDGTPNKMLKLILHKVVSISAVVRIENKLILQSLPDANRKTEPEILKAFTLGIGDKKMQVVGWASRLFDLPVIAQRCLVHGVNVPEFFERPEKPWLGPDYLAKNSDYAVDLIDDISCTSDGKARMKFDMACRACGIPGKLGMDGEDVEACYYDRQDLKSICEYNDYDALSTYWLWARMAALSGLVSYEQEVIALRNLVLKEIANNKKHLKTYAKAAGW